MKKTIIAASIAALVAAPAAFADLKVSGQINIELENKDGTSDTFMDENADIVFSGSEDLGNGMKAFFKIATSPDGSGASLGEDDRFVGLSGDFGSIKFGRYETMMTSHGTDMANSLASTEVLSVEAQPVDSSNTRGNEGVNYTSPSFNGITVSVGGWISGTGENYSSTNTSEFDETEAMVQYSNNGLTVRYVSRNSDTATEDSSVIGATYTMGDLTVGLTDLSSDDTSEEATIVGAKYKMGNNTLGAAYVADHNTAANDGDYIVTAKHSLSKSTTVWVGFEDKANVDTTSIGLQHKF